MVKFYGILLVCTEHNPGWKCHRVPEGRICSRSVHGVVFIIIIIIILSVPFPLDIVWFTCGIRKWAADWEPPRQGAGPVRGALGFAKGFALPFAFLDLLPLPSLTGNK